MPTVPSTPELLAYIRECGIDFSTGKPIETRPTEAPEIDEKAGEKEFQSWFDKLADETGWKHHHETDSRKSPEGFLDNVLLRKERLVVAELKTWKGKLTPAQKRWVNAWRLIPSAEVYVWRPKDIQEIKRVLGELL